MTSLAQLPPRGTQMARALGNRVKLLSRKSAASPALNRCAWRNLRPIQRRNRQEPGPTFTPGRSPLPALTLGGDPFQNDQLRRTVLPTSCGCQVDNTTSCILCLFSPNQKSYPLRFPRFSIFRAGRGVGVPMPPLPRIVCQHAFRHPLFRVEASSSQRISASFSPRNSKLESWPTLWTLAPRCSRFNAYSRCSYVDSCGL